MLARTIASIAVLLFATVGGPPPPSYPTESNAPAWRLVAAFGVIVLIWMN